MRRCLLKTMCWPIWPKVRPCVSDCLQQEPDIAHSMTQVRLRLLEQGCLSAGYSDDQARADGGSGL